MEEEKRDGGGPELGAAAPSHETLTPLANIEDSTIKELVTWCDDEEYLSSLKLNKEEIKALRKQLLQIYDGDSAYLPLVCSGPRCIYRRICTFCLSNKPPIGKSCPFETAAVKKWTKDYVDSLKVNLDDKTERTQVMDLVECDLMNARANAIIGDESVIMHQPIGIDPNTGEPIMQRQKHVAFQIKEQSQERKDKILKNFIATRSAKLKGLSEAGVDVTKYMSDLKAKAKRIVEAEQAVVVEEKKDMF